MLKTILGAIALPNSTYLKMAVLHMINSMIFIFGLGEEEAGKQPIRS